ncbi:MAG: RNA 2',3'-cyclic phosphodiesterase [Candidatus Eremiobacter antarcticus]|nr:RNA 2',3'-cyclic phosphodiesterase [Candidatus Eremiobacteraeota bacterium]MBC5808066.1 RNA 2',3'-cyclic phosphodiesterase [Candidatus Eremiobacteraeota bacterium]PZR63468.1 MAG: RNA 2',3'-cyclic phosphodiesterase [Candidatus Eremiobacter sp. RRmetagenome_bin22]
MRLFVALDLDEAARNCAMAAMTMLAERGVGGRLEAREKLHVTLAFLGSVSDDRLADVTKSLHEAAAKCRPFSLDLDSFGAFPNERRPRVLWIGPSQPSAGFDECAVQVQNAYSALGWLLDRKAHPHVTICRLKGSAAVVLPPLAHTAKVEMTGLTLYRSVPAGQTTRYIALQRAPFS